MESNPLMMSMQQQLLAVAAADDHQRRPMVTRSKGRRKIEIKKIEKRENLQVCFTKRRYGIFKKACELSILCGVDIAVLVFSPAGRPFSFSTTPSINTIINNYLLHPSTAPDHSGQHHPPHFDGMLHELNDHHNEILRQIDDHRSGKNLLTRIQKWWNSDLGELGIDQLEEFKSDLEVLKTKLGKCIDERQLVQSQHGAGAAINAAAAAPNFYFGNSSNAAYNNQNYIDDQWVEGVISEPYGVIDQAPADQLQAVGGSIMEKKQLIMYHDGVNVSMQQQNFGMNLVRDAFGSYSMPSTSSSSSSSSLRQFDHQASSSTMLTNYN